MAAAWNAGIRCFDTAPVYSVGRSEVALGLALARFPRAEYVLSTKVGRLLNSGEGFGGSGEGQWSWDFSRDGVRRSLDASLTRLRTDRVDIAYLHDPDEYVGPSGFLHVAMDALAELRSEGAVERIGVGSKSATAIADIIERFAVDAVMVAGRLTLLDRSAEAPIAEASRRGISVATAGVYNSGILSSDEVSDSVQYDYAQAAPGVIARARRLALLCASFGVPLGAAAIQFPLRFPAVDSVFMGAVDEAEVNDNLRRLRWEIPTELWEAIDSDVWTIDQNSAPFPPNINVIEGASA